MQRNGVGAGMNDIRAIETVYNGYKFRSRLEARWAVFFDSLGVKYDYEPEGVEVGGVKYLPDFLLRELDWFLEIKPRSGGDLSKANHFSKAGLNIAAIQGSPWPFDFELLLPFKDGITSVGAECQFIHCSDCGHVAIEIVHPFSRIRFIHDFACIPNQHQTLHGYSFVNKGDSPDADNSRLVWAYIRARQARFEFGETPTPPSQP
jgi:hypothetical protein